MPTEFNLIDHYFTRPAANADLGIGDDAALIQVSQGHQLAVSSDMSVVGTHFFAEAAPYDIGWKSLAVNVSDMAAMGATPKWVTLSIALPKTNPEWLAAFSDGFFACADAFNISLIGGDTTKGSLNISVSILGEVPIGKAITRSNAQAGDDIWVSGQLGSAALGLMHLQGKHQLNTDDQDVCLNALNQPQPRAALGIALRDIAHSCIDISDGLMADLGHILKASGLGAAITLAQCPCLALAKTQLSNQHIQQAILAGGDDYELCFTAPPQQKTGILALAKKLGIPLTCIGTTNTTGTLSVTHQGNAINLSQLGYDHFAKTT